MNLNLGSGKRDMEDYINIDAVKQTKNTVVGDILNLDYPDNSINKIYSEHVIEHFTKNELDTFFSECSRLLVPGGELSIVAPSMEKVIGRYCNKEVDIIYLENFLFALHQHKYDFHKQGIYKIKLERLCSKYKFNVENIWYQDRDFSMNEICLIAYRDKL